MRRCLLPSQLYTITSPGPLPSVSPPRCSTSFLNPAAFAASATIFLTPLCLMSVEDHPGHTTEWFPFTSQNWDLQTWHLVFIGATSSRSLLRVASNQCSGVIFHFLKDSGIILVHLWFDPELGSTWIFSWPESVAHTRLCSWNSQCWKRLSK